MAHLLKQRPEYELVPFHRKTTSASSFTTLQEGSKRTTYVPGKLKSRGHVAAGQIPFALLILSTCIPFLVYGGCVSRYNGHSTNDHPKLKPALGQAAKIVRLSISTAETS